MPSASSLSPDGGFHGKFWRYYDWLLRNYSNGKDVSNLNYDEFKARGSAARKRRQEADLEAKRRASQG